jgi:dephospho-CoA kinase
MRRMLRIGLTGNIGSGKSTTASILAELGATVIDADRIARELLVPGSPPYERVVGAFGPEILEADGITIDRRKLGRIVFQSVHKRSILNSCVHPEVRAEIKRRISELEKSRPDGIVVVDAALMVETGFYQFFDRVIVVICDPEIQRTRVIRRDGLSAEEVSARMASQMPAEEKAKVADYRINTSGSFEETRRQVVAVYMDLLRVQNTRQSGPEAPSFGS